MKWNLIILVLVLLSTTVMASDLQLEWDVKYCNTDFDCSSAYICITSYTDSEIFSLSSRSDSNVFKAMKLNKEGMCARVYYDVDEDNRIYYNKYVGTQNIPEESSYMKSVLLEDQLIDLYNKGKGMSSSVCEECQVCENKTEYEDKIIIEQHYFGLVWSIIIFLILMVGEYYFYKYKFTKKYGSKIAQFERLQKFSPDFVKRENIKSLSIEEMSKRIKASEGKK